MFARMVATALLVAGIGIPSLALAADQAEHFTLSSPSAAQTPAPAAVTQPAAPTSPSVQPVAQPKVAPVKAAAPAQPAAQPAQQAPSVPAAQQSEGDDEEAAPSSTDTGEATPSGPLTSTDKIVKSFMQLDTDKSNAVSFDEYMTMVQQRAKDRFDAMDSNHDGQVTADEYRQFWLHRMAHWYRLKR